MVNAEHLEKKLMNIVKGRKATVKRRVRSSVDSFEEILNSYINGNLSWVRNKYKKMRGANRARFVEFARENLTNQDFEFFKRSILEI